MIRKNQKNYYDSNEDYTNIGYVTKNLNELTHVLSVRIYWFKQFDHFLISKLHINKKGHEQKPKRHWLCIVQEFQFKSKVSTKILFVKFYTKW